jgi:hypothetical protein
MLFLCWVNAGREWGLAQVAKALDYGIEIIGFGKWAAISKLMGYLWTIS